MLKGLKAITLDKTDGLLIVDVQNDFLPGGALAVRRGEEVLPVINRLIPAFQARGLGIFATRCWHPANHCSFHAAGGPWPRHCIAGTSGAAFAATLALPPSAQIVSKAATAERDAYSGFDHTDLDQLLRAAGVRRLMVGGLATDYCVLNTVKDGLSLGYQVVVVTDAIRAVDVHPGDGERAIAEMAQLGALFCDHFQILA
jgi:nicotinamidase-related amidase